MREREGKFKLARINRMDAIRSQLDSRWIIYFETIRFSMRYHVDVAYISVGGRYDSSSYRTYGTEKSALLPLEFSRRVVFSFFIFAARIPYLVTAKKPVRRIARSSREHRKHTRDNVHRKNTTAKKYDSPLWKFAASP